MNRDHMPERHLRDQQLKGYVEVHAGRTFLRLFGSFVTGNRVLVLIYAFYAMKYDAQGWSALIYTGWVAIMFGKTLNILEKDVESFWRVGGGKG